VIPLWPDLQWKVAMLSDMSIAEAANQLADQPTCQSSTLGDFFAFFNPG